ncbi:ferredoxin [Albidovulum sp.]|uniref:ferredoxin n=1 Tax=Albidovulum sp. TaxID=1872424 RepID=UPI0039B8C174
MTAYDDIAAGAAGAALDIFGAFHPKAGDGMPEGSGTLFLLGPREPGFWATFTASPEWQDGAADPMDRWSVRVLGRLAEDMGGRALFPFGGPPHHPFFAWALRSGRAFASPATLLVHDTAGLMVSYRGAIALPDRIDLPAPPGVSPCESCVDRPCLSACPPRALTAGGYDLAACHAFLDTAPGAECLSAGCLVRRACPVSHRYGRLPEQSAHHMRLFHR